MGDSYSSRWRVSEGRHCVGIWGTVVTLERQGDIQKLRPPVVARGSSGRTDGPLGPWGGSRVMREGGAEKDKTNRYYT